MTVRIVLCTSGGVFGAVVLQRLLASENVEVVGVIESTRILRARYSWCRGAYWQLRTSGIAYALYLWSATGLADLLGRYSPLGSVSSQAAGRNIPRFITRNLNDRLGTEFVRLLAPDLLLSAFFNQRIEELTYRIPTFGAINIHPSLLPQFRGVDPVFFGRLRDQRQFGVTIHRVDATLDTGNILLQQTHVPEPDDSVMKTTAELYALGGDLVARHIREFLQSGAGNPQQGSGSYDSWPSSGEVMAFRQKGFRLMSGRDLCGLARGTFGGRRVQ